MDASVTELVNTGTITAILVGRDGQAVAIRDASGTLTSLNNSGIIASIGQNSDPNGLEDTSFDLVALDVSALTEDFTFTQTAPENTNINATVRGDLRFGSGDDTVSASDGTIIGDIDFGGGNDSFLLSGGAEYAGGISNTDGLTLSVTEGSTLALTSAESIAVDSATFGATSSFRPILNGTDRSASTLTSTGDITFEAGATINPLLESIIIQDVGDGQQTFMLASAGNLDVGDLAGLSSGVSPFLFDSNLSLSDPNTLVITLDLRDPAAAMDAGGLGLDPVQVAAFGEFVDGQFAPSAAFQAFATTPELGNAIANITEAAEFYAAINQVLPEFSGAANQFVLANVDGAVGAVGSHLDAARRSPDKTGGAWIEEFFYFADRELAGLSEQYRGEGFGFTGGLDTGLRSVSRRWCQCRLCQHGGRGCRRNRRANGCPHLFARHLCGI